jgi:hypothetical protein
MSPCRRSPVTAKCREGSIKIYDYENLVGDGVYHI